MNTLIKMVFLIAIINASDLALKFKMPGQKIKFLNIDGQNLKLEEMKGEKGTLIIFSCNRIVSVAPQIAVFINLAL